MKSNSAHQLGRVAATFFPLQCGQWGEVEDFTAGLSEDVMKSKNSSKEKWEFQGSMEAERRGVKAETSSPFESKDEGECSSDLMQI